MITNLMDITVNIQTANGKFYAGACSNGQMYVKEVETFDEARKLCALALRRLAEDFEAPLT